MRQRQKGFTLIELLVVLAITGVIITPLTWATITLLTSPQRTAAHGIVLQQVQNAGHWISRDVQMARSVNATGTNGFPLVLTIPVDDNPDNDYSVEYIFDGDSLKREEYDSAHTLVAEMLIAQYIVSDNTTFSSLPSGSYQLSIRAAKGVAAVTINYEVKPRLSSG